MAPDIGREPERSVTPYHGMKREGTAVRRRAAFSLSKN